MINLEKATPSGGIRLPMMLPGIPLENLRGGAVSASGTDRPIPSISLNSGPATSGFQVLGTTNNALPPPVSDPRFIDSKYKSFFSFYFVVLICETFSLAQEIPTMIFLKCLSLR